MKVTGKLITWGMGVNKAPLNQTNAVIELPPVDPKDLKNRKEILVKGIYGWSNDKGHCLYLGNGVVYPIKYENIVAVVDPETEPKEEPKRNCKTCKSDTADYSCFKCQDCYAPELKNWSKKTEPGKKNDGLDYLREAYKEATQVKPKEVEEKKEEVDWLKIKLDELDVMSAEFTNNMHYIADKYNKLVDEVNLHLSKTCIPKP